MADGTIRSYKTPNLNILDEIVFEQLKLSGRFEDQIGLVLNFMPATYWLAVPPDCAKLG